MAYDMGCSESDARPELRGVRVLPGAGGRSPSSSIVTLAEVLRLPAVERALPQVLGGDQWLSRAITGLRVVDRMDERELLTGGELVVVTDVVPLWASEEIRQYIADLAAQGAAAIMVELGRPLTRVPEVIVRACARHSMPIVALRRAVPLEQVALSVDTAVLHADRALLEATAASHRRFVELSLDDAPLADFVAAIAELARGQVVFSNVLHQVISLDALGGSAEELIGRWRQQELRGGSLRGTTIDDDSGAVVVRVELKQQLRGRLAMFTSAPVDPAQIAVLERGAAALAIRLNHVSDELVWEDARRSLLADLLTARYASAEAAVARASAAGHDIRGTMAVAVIRCDDGDVGEQLRRAFAHAKVDALAGPLGPGLWGALVMLTQADDDAIDRAAGRLHLLAATAGMKATVGRGGSVDDLAGIRRSYAEAVEVAGAAHEAGAFAQHRGCYTIHDVGLRGLLVALREDPRVQAFAERMLRPLMERDRREAGDWVHTLEVYLRLGGNKSMAAIELGISRQTLYQRLSRIQRMLDVDIDDSETRTSLHAAVMTIEVERSAEPENSKELPAIPAIVDRWQVTT